MTIERIANRVQSANNFKMLVTNTHEVLAYDGIHGKIACVGQGFGTGRHTANLQRKRRQQSTDHDIFEDEYNIKINSMKV